MSSVVRLFACRSKSCATLISVPIARSSVPRVWRKLCHPMIFPSNTGPDKSWSNGFLEQAVRTEWFGSIQPDGREQEIAIVFVERLALPIEQRFQDEGMKWNRAARAFRLRVSEPIAHTGFGNAHLHCLDVDIRPNQSHQFGSTYASTPNQ